MTMPDDSSTPIPFFDSSGELDFAAAMRCLRESKPDDLRRQLSSWNADPTDLLAVADIAGQSEYKQHARVLYAHALTAMEHDPTLIATDTNRSGAYHVYGFILLELGEFLDASEQFVKATTIDPTDAISWYMLGICQAVQGQLEEAVKNFERTLNLEGKDRHQDAKFYVTVREKLAYVKDLMTQLDDRSPRGRRSPIRDLDEAREHLGRKGIELQRSRVMVPVKKQNWDSPMLAEVCTFEKSGDQYSIIILTLPYFFGPDWYKKTGGNPQAIDCESVDEMVQVLEIAIAKRMVDGYLPIPS